jgi:c-di-GMP-binding flagellar brake protein YcgR
MMKTTEIDRTAKLQHATDPALDSRDPEQTQDNYLDRRGAERAPMECPVSFTSEERHDYRAEVEGTLRDLSKTGCQIFSLQPPSQGSQITLILFLPDGGPPMRLIGTAVRHVRGRVFGAEFLLLTPEERRRLQAIVFKYVTWSVFSLRRPAFRIAGQ